MHCVSLHQFWASLVEIRAKLIETRHWPTHYRGPLAIHASATTPVYARDEYRENEPVRRLLLEHFGIENEYSMQRKLPRGAVVAVVDLVDVIQVPTLPISLDELVPAKYRTADFQSFGNFKPERYLWLLDNVRRLRQPLKLKARQNVWPLADDIVEKIAMRI